MTIRPTAIPEVLVVEPKIIRDGRGFFIETYREQRYVEQGIKHRFVQDNLSFSSKGTLRGLHLQNPTAQAKLVYVLHGEVLDVAVDVRVGSPTFGKWVGESLSAHNGRQLFIPEGFAHGFCVVSETALFAYKCSAAYSPQDEITVAWNDPAIGIDWPVKEPSLSARDDAARPLEEILRERLPLFV